MDEGFGKDILWEHCCVWWCHASGSSEGRAFESHVEVRAIRASLSIQATWVVMSVLWMNFPCFINLKWCLPQCFCRNVFSDDGSQMPSDAAASAVQVCSFLHFSLSLCVNMWYKWCTQSPLQYALGLALHRFKLYIGCGLFPFFSLVKIILHLDIQILIYCFEVVEWWIYEELCFQFPLFFLFYLGADWLYFPHPLLLSIFSLNLKLFSYYSIFTIYNFCDVFFLFSSIFSCISVVILGKDQNIGYWCVLALWQIQSGLP